jgi:23S rRNA pseudouridine1911/1915/1917 synthase
LSAHERWDPICEKELILSNLSVKMSKKSREQKKRSKQQNAAVEAITVVAAPISKAAKRREQKKRAQQAARTQAERARREKQAKVVRAPTASAATLKVVHEDDEVLAINKPAGLLCHPSPGYWDRGTIVHLLASRQRVEGYSPIAPEMLESRQAPTGEADSFIPRVIVHRLDRGTTGLLLVAKTPAAEAHLAAQFRARSLQKRYVALLVGRPRSEGSGLTSRGLGVTEVDLPIASDPARPGRVVVGQGGKAARSVLHLHAVDEAQHVSLVSVELLTGRQHQIRAHCAHLGAPVANDGDYGSEAGVLSFQQGLGKLPRGRALLHAWSLSVPHPTQGQPPLTLRAPLPADMLSIVSQLWPSLPVDPAAWPHLPTKQPAGAAQTSASMNDPQLAVVPPPGPAGQNKRKLEPSVARNDWAGKRVR